MHFSMTGSTNYIKTINLAPPIQPHKIIEPFVYAGRPKTVLHYSKQNCLLIINDDEGCIGWIYKYDLSTNQYIEFIKEYPSNISFLDAHCNFVIDEETHKLVVFRSAMSNPSITAVFFELDLIQKQIITIVTDQEAELQYNLKNMYFPISIWLPSPISEIHSMSRSPDIMNYNHYKYDQDENKFLKLYTAESVPPVSRSLLYIESQRKLVVTCLKKGGFAFCDIYTNEWEESDIKSPAYDPNAFGTCWQTVNVFDTIIISVNYNTMDIYILDLLTDDKIWLKSDKKFPEGCAGAGDRFLIPIKNWIHFYGFYHEKHFKFSIMQILPKSIYNKYTNMYFNIVG
eukprot:224276_1